MKKLYKVKRAYRSRDYTGFKFGRLTAQWPVGKRGTATVWLCLCDCGNTSIIRTSQIKSDSKTKSCGCLQKESTSARFLKHGLLCGSIQDHMRYDLHRGAKNRAKKLNLPFNLKLEDLVIPSICPVLGISLNLNRGKLSDFSPTLDRMIPSLGYVKSNVQIISNRANRIKSNATLEEVKNLVIYMEKHYVTHSNTHLDCQY